MKILFSGGGTLGPVAPLLAIYEIYRRHNPQCKFVWVGTSHGPERDIVELYNIPFFVITGGKWRRYFSLWNLVDILKIIVGFFQSLVLLVREKPTLLITAGGFVSVPLHWAANALGIPTWVHQQDVQVGLANRLMMRSAKKITTALDSSQQFFINKKLKNKVEWLGNPVRDLTVADQTKSRQKFKLAPTGPVIFIFGGGTGSTKINRLTVEALPHLPKDYQIIHLVGKDRDSEFVQGATRSFTNYHPYRFFTQEMKDAYTIADVVVGRGGFVTITELAALAKPAILLPMSNTHQEANVKLLAEHKAAIILDEKKVSGLNIAHTVRELISKPEVARYLGNRLHEIVPPAEAVRIIQIIDELTKN